MKKVLLVAFAVMFAVSMTVPVYAASGWEKLSAGGERVVKSPMQIFDTVQEEYDASTFKPFGVAGGVFKGLFFMGKDVVHGVFDILTFPIDFEK